MSTTTRFDFLTDLASILRFHIILIAMTATLVFGWLFTGEYVWGIALLGGLDWCLINLLNKLADVEEDRANHIRGTAQIATYGRQYRAAWLGLLLLSFGIGLWLFPELTLVRVIVQLIGVGYSFRVVPTPRGLKRFKEIYFLKNFMSSVLFVLTVFVYTLMTFDGQLGVPGGMAAVTALILFFVSFELTYEILYDLRDLDGDRLASIPTYPVVHGSDVSTKIIDSLLSLAAVTLLLGVGVGWLGLREGLMILAPGIQFVWYRTRVQRGLTSADCIWLTHMGTALLAFYLVGTAVWTAVGLPHNVLLFS